MPEAKAFTRYVHRDPDINRIVQDIYDKLNQLMTVVGTSTSTASTGQTPWGSDEDAAGHTLINLAQLSMGPKTVITPLRVVAVRGSDQQNYSNQILLQAFQAAFEVLNAAATQNFFFGIDDNDGNKLKIARGRSASQGLATAMTVDPTGDYVGLGGITSPAVSGTGKVQVGGDTLRMVSSARTPANSAATGNDGESCMDSSFLYIHSGGSWRRVAVSTF